MTKLDEIQEWVNDLGSTTDELHSLKDHYTQRYYEEESTNKTKDPTKRHAYVDDLTTSIQDGISDFRDSIINISSSVLEILNTQETELSLISTSVKSLSNRINICKEDSGMNNQYICIPEEKELPSIKEVDSVINMPPLLIEMDTSNNPFTSKTIVGMTSFTNTTFTFIDPQLQQNQESLRDRNVPQPVVNEPPPPPLPSVPKPALPSVPKPKLSDIMNSSSSSSPSPASISIPSNTFENDSVIHPSLPTASSFSTPPPPRPMAAKPSLPGGFKRATVQRPTKPKHSAASSVPTALSPLAPTPSPKYTTTTSTSTPPPPPPPPSQTSRPISTDNYMYKTTGSSLSPLNTPLGTPLEPLHTSISTSPYPSLPLPTKPSRGSISRTPPPPPSVSPSVPVKLPMRPPPNRPMSLPPRPVPPRPVPPRPVLRRTSNERSDNDLLGHNGW
ncbi:hypothetical protein WA158_008047 [Blastocystis sp. Blastoise]